jgi:ABC-type phosphate/phosphonate transport system substrate-binding protein
MAVASLPMYDLPEIEAWFDELWTGFARHFRRQGLEEVPAQLLRGPPLEALWRDPELWFSQCCGYDVVHGYAGCLKPVATPHFDAPGCVGRDYSSFVVVADASPARTLADLRDTAVAINGYDSHSGMSALRALVAPLSHGGRFFAETKVSGRHVGSLHMVRSGAADVAAIDCVTMALLARYRPDALDGTRTIAQTAPVPGIPYVTRTERGEDFVARLRAGLAQAFDDPSLAGVREALLLKAVEPTSVADYASVAATAAFAVDRGYPELR